MLRKVHKVQILPPQPPLCTSPQAAGIERPFGFGGDPVTTPALGVALPTITTPADGCLAVAVQIYGDSSDEVAGATLKGGETGDAWTKVGELLGVTGGVPTADRPRSSPRCRPPARSRAAASTRARPTRRTRSA